MKRLKWFGMLLTLCLTTACAPAVIGVDYHHHNQRIVRHMIMPIEVTLYTDSNYRGRHFETVRLVIADGQYVAIPVKDRRGRQTQIFAHYYQQNLHLDTDTNCRGLEGSSQFKYDKSWERGHHYTNITAGSRYDLRGIQLSVHVASQIELHSRGTFEHQNSIQKDPQNKKQHNNKQHNNKPDESPVQRALKSNNDGHDHRDRQHLNTQFNQKTQDISKPHIVKKIKQVEKQKEHIKDKKVVRSKKSQPDVVEVREDIYAQQQAVSQNISTKRHSKNK